jgi:hypothetical protein
MYWKGFTPSEVGKAGEIYSHAGKTGASQDQDDEESQRLHCEREKCK